MGSKRLTPTRVGKMASKCLFVVVACFLSLVINLSIDSSCIIFLNICLS